MKSVDELNTEIADIDAEIKRLEAQVAQADLGIAAAALPALRGDEQAQQQLRNFEESKTAAQSRRNQLTAARGAVNVELSSARQTVEHAAEHARAEQAKKIIAIFRKRGEEIDAALRTLLENYEALDSDVVKLNALLPVQINPRIVSVNAERALRTALMRTRLELPRVPPNERHNFSELINKWAQGAERRADAILKQGEPNPVISEKSHV